jgi:hypothetical protein
MGILFNRFKAIILAFKAGRLTLYKQNNVPGTFTTSCQG